MVSSSEEGREKGEERTRREKRKRKRKRKRMVLPVINVKKDIQTLTLFVMDCLRAVVTGKTKIGGLGYIANQSDGCIQRGIGRNVKANRIKTDKMFSGFFTIGCMQNALLTSKDVYRTLVSSLHQYG